MSEERKRIIVQDGVDENGHFIPVKKTRKKTPSAATVAASKPRSLKRTTAATKPAVTSAKLSQSLLNTIRKNYQNNQSQLLDNVGTTMPVDKNKIVQEFKETALDTATGRTDSESEQKAQNSEFISSMEFINQVVKNATAPVPTAATSPIPTIAKAVLPAEAVGIAQKINYHHILTPSYGCLKAGVLPTYRTLNTLTQQQIPINASTAVINSSTVPLPPALLPATIPGSTVKTISTAAATATTELTGIQDISKPVQYPRHHRTKTIRRTFRVGRLSNKPVVSVLLPNETIRRRVLNQKYSLNSIALNQIKKELIKAGLIKIGSDAPENILRKMYENMVLIGGPVKNFNPDIIAYNLLHHPEVYAT